MDASRDLLDVPAFVHGDVVDDEVELVVAVEVLQRRVDELDSLL
jgi:hypothetical protein